MTAAFVLDASAAIAGLAPDENCAACALLLERALIETAAVPSIWPYEVANILTLKRRRGLLSDESCALAIQSLVDLRPEIHSFDPGGAAFNSAIELAARHNLTVYDAAYLELSIRLRLPLASLDRALLDAAARASVAII